MKPTIKRENRFVVLKIVGTYLFFGVLWIFLSDTILGWIIHDPEIITYIAMFKGILFILLTAILLYYLISRHVLKFKSAQEQLKESEERYRSILEDMEEAYYEVDLKGRFTFFNPSIARTYGYTEEEIMGASYTTAMDKENIDKVFNAFHQVYVTGETIKGVDWKLRNKDGKEVHVEASVSLRRDGKGNPIGFRGVTRDISERKKAEEDLKKSEESYRFLAENARDVIWTFDFNSGFTYMSPSIEYLRGFTVDEAIKQTLDQTLTPESYAKAAKMVETEQRLEMNGQRHDGKWSKTIELEQFRKDGSTVWTEVIVNVLYDENNVVKGIMGVTRDISERKKAEEEKKRLEDRLIQAQKMESIGTLAGGIAHDFNNLLTGILGNVSLAIMGLDSGNLMRERLKNVEEYVQRGSDLTKQLLGFARGGQYEVKPTNLGEFIIKSSDMFGRTKKEIHIHKKVQEGLWVVEVDRGQMEQVLLNLYVNAWQAMTGGGDLYISVENVELCETDVSPYGIEPGRFVKTVVTDTGIGMDEDTMSRIFEPFFTTKGLGRGTGLGLASVYGIVKNHGGFVTVDSRKGNGSSFTIYLPASNKEIEDIDISKDDILTGNETILLIDDEEMILDIASEMLESLGYRVITAVGGKQGLEIYNKDRDNIDLVILDMIMPDYNGKETFDDLRRMNPSLNVLLSSGYSLDGQAKEILQNGCSGFVQKPFTILELSKKIREILDQP